MIAKLPEGVQNLVDAWPLIAAFFAFVGWLMRRQRAWTRQNISDPIEKLRTESAATRHLVSYHLGPNGTTKALHHRVSDIERANGIEDTSPKDWMKDDWGQE